MKAFIAALLAAAAVGCSAPSEPGLDYTEGILVPLFIDQLVETIEGRAAISFTPPQCASPEIIVRQLQVGDELMIQAFAQIRDPECADLTAPGERTAELIRLAVGDDGQETVVYDGWCLAVGLPCETPRGDLLSGLALPRERPE